MKAVSKHLSSRQIRAINGLGNLMLPGCDAMPKFSDTACVRNVDRVLDYMPASDLSDLKLLLLILSFLPGFMLRGFLNLIEKSPNSNGPLGPVLRLIRLGLRGLIMTLYYGDEQIHRRIQYEVRVVPK